MTTIIELFRGDALEVLRSLRSASVDSIVTDPPYGLSKEPDAAEVLRHWLNGDDYTHKGGGFMGKGWDSFVPGPSVWKECLRVLKPGGHLLCFAGSRTVDLMGMSIRLAGFEIRDQIQWLYGSGFPKSMNVSKAIDKAAGVEDGQWQGWGTALKPAHEPIIVARKPLGERTVAANVLTHGTGALNIDATRISWGAEGDKSADRKAKGYTDAAKKALGKTVASESATGFSGDVVGTDSTGGRWPANVIFTHHEDCIEVGTTVVKGDSRAGMDPGSRKGGFYDPGSDKGDIKPNGTLHGDSVQPVFDCHDDCAVRRLDAQSGTQRHLYGDSGGASRFFYCAKTAKSERNAGMPDGEVNNHPTVKPLALMRYLVKMVTPPDGTVLDPYVGSGTTAIAAHIEGFHAIGIDRDDDGGYIRIAQRRLQANGADPIIDGTSGGAA